MNLRNPDQASPREDGSTEIRLLRVYDGYACRLCKFRTTSLQLMKRHYTEPLTAGQGCPCDTSRAPKRSSTHVDDLIEYVYLQTWKSGPGRKYWLVKKNESAIRPVGGQQGSDHLMAVREREHARTQERMKQLPNAEETTMLPRLTFAEQRPWLERTGWEDTYRGRDHRLLSALSAMPTKHAQMLAEAGAGNTMPDDLMSPAVHEQRIAATLKLFDILMDRCEETAGKTSRNILYWLRSVRVQSSYSKPFNLVRLSSSTKKYRLLFKKALAFAFRLYLLEPCVQMKLTGIRLRKNQVRLLDKKME